MSYRYILAFGSNLGNREVNCQRGQDYLKTVGEIVRVSEFLHTEPLKSDFFPVPENQEFYLNFILELRTDLEPVELYRKIVAIEDEVGHDRTRKWAPRHLDIDILLVAEDEEGKRFDECSLFNFSNDSDLQIPHAELMRRPFLVKLLSEDFQVLCPA